MWLILGGNWGNMRLQYEYSSIHWLALDFVTGLCHWTKVVYGHSITDTLHLDTRTNSHTRFPSPSPGTLFDSFGAVLGMGGDDDDDDDDDEDGDGEGNDGIDAEAGGTGFGEGKAD